MAAAPDTYLCDLKESQIRDGLHVFGQSPAGRLRLDTLLALLRVERGDGRGGNASLLRTWPRRWYPASTRWIANSASRGRATAPSRCKR